MQKLPRTLCACLFLLFAFGDQDFVQAQTAEAVFIDAYPNTTMVEQGTTLILVCRVVGVASTTVLSYQWTCPGGYCDAGAVDPEWAARIQQDNILVVNICNGNDNGTYTCIVMANRQQVGNTNYTLSVKNGLSLLNEKGGLRVFFPRNSFITNTTLTRTNSPRGVNTGNDHIACYGGDPQDAQVTWHNSSGGQLLECQNDVGPAPCHHCGPRCVANGAVGQDGPVNGLTDIHMYTDASAYVNQDLECRVSGGQSAFIGVYLKNGVNTALQPPSSITQGATTNTSVSVSWSQVLNATGYYVSYQRQDLGNPPVVPPQYERIVGGDNTSVTLSGLEPETIYRIRVWSTDGTSVSSEAREMDVPAVEGSITAKVDPDNTGVIVAVVIILLLLATGGIVTVVVIGVLFWKRKRKDQTYQPKATSIPNDFLHVVEQGTIREPAKPQSHSNNIALIDTTHEEINEKDCQPYKLSLVSNEESSMPTEAAGVHVYAAVAKKSKKKPKAVEATTEESPMKALETAQTAETWPCAALTRPLPYESKTSNGSKTVMNDSAFDGYLKKVASMHAQGKSSFEEEFNSVDMKTASSTVVAEQNNAKNRYKNIFPYDSSRVVLSVPNTSGTDYINASFVDGYKKRNSYIASQAPVPGTVDDFWQMAWDQQINIVVMLTKTMEGSKRKSEDYYPESPAGMLNCGRFQIRTISLKYHVDYEVRVLEVAQVSDPSQTRTLDHYLFTGWPDYGVPKYPTSLIRMLYHVRDARVSVVPILVHCSAGVGRTGTFIALDITLDQMKAEKTVDIKGTVQRMRQKRMYMIQTVDQYMFVHDAVRELLLLGDTTIKASDLRNIISQLKGKGGGSNSYQQQFDALNTLTQESADDERVEEDPQAIRYPDRAPFQNKHMFVNRPGASGSVLINASLVDGYHAPRAFIAAQSPMQSTVDDFWTLIAEKKVQTALLLCQLVEDSQDVCHQFWPAEDDILTVGQMKVTLLNKKTRGDIDTYRMAIQMPKSTQDVTLLHYKQWREKKRPKSTSFLKLFTTALKLQQPHSNKPIVVACNDGLGRTGTFIAIWSLIEQMKAEGQIDVVGTIKSIRTQRPGAVPHLDQYVYCHDLLLEYVDSFEGYSNFSV